MVTDMHNSSCIFCKIISGAIPATIIDEDEHVIVIQDINPKAPIHYLLIPRVHVHNIQGLREHDGPCIIALMMMAQKLSKKLSGSQSFRLIMNNGADSGQSVFHLHAHFLSGKKMTDF
jgi:histidine triad (HIT) family protein